MNKNNVDLQEEISLAFKKSTADKLAWRLEVANAIRDCRMYKGTFAFKYKVLALEDMIYFNIPGYNLIGELEKTKDAITEELNEIIIEYNEHAGSKKYKRAYIAKFKIIKEKWFWDNYFRGIIQILGNHNLLFDTEKYVHIKEVKQFDDA